jgi:DNA repair protein RecN (Recombination protein N)
MLEYLRIRDLALIRDAELEFASGMNVLTGETGAGKSFILKALGFLMGDGLGRDMVRPGGERAFVEALFSLPEEEFVLRRELVAESGRSRFYMNDRLCSQEVVRELRGGLFFHISQHGQQKLLQPAYQAALVDTALEDPALLKERDALLETWRENAERGELLREKARSVEAERELLEMRRREIDKVAPRPGEEEELEGRRAEARARAALAGDYDEALGILHGGGEELALLLRRLERVLERLAASAEGAGRFSPALEAVARLLERLPDLEKNLRRVPGALSPKELDELEARLYALARLKRTLRRSLDEILALRGEMEEKLSFLDLCALDMKRIAARDAELREDLGALLRRLVPLRRAAGERFARRLEEELAGLGFSEKLRVDVEYAPVEIAPGCIDERARLLWAPNPGQLPRTLERIASGGELSRFLLALTGMRAPEEHATLIFDEVDAGIGGLTLMRLADRLEKLAAERQVLLVTHWPQLAARAERHFLVSKDVLEEETFTLCKRLDADAIRLELARMGGGGSSAEDFAADLLRRAPERKRPS